MNVFRAPEGFLIALTYGRESEWVKNVVASGTCQLETYRLLYQLSARLSTPLPPVQIQVFVRPMQ